MDKTAGKVNRLREELNAWVDDRRMVEDEVRQFAMMHEGVDFKSFPIMISEGGVAVVALSLEVSNAIEHFTKELERIGHKVIPCYRDLKSRGWIACDLTPRFSVHFVNMKHAKLGSMGPVKTYISGPMTGKPGLNGKAFYDAERELLASGFQVVNPQRISHVVDRQCSELGTVATYEDYMRADLIALPSECSTIYMLKGWEDSPGARCEHDVAKICGMEIIYQERACK